jgi:AraC family transcriptional regulator
MTTIYIKNMVCPRCIKAVEDEFSKLGFNIKHIALGKAEIENAVSSSDIENIKAALNKNGFELLDDNNSKIIERIKILIITNIRESDSHKKDVNLSEFLSENIHMDYSHLSHLFSSVEGKTIERFMILQKIERIKELISYHELSIKQIADQLGYSSLQALSSQFKKETGFTPSAFKKQFDPDNRKPISDI